MNIYNNFILIKGEDKTQNIESCQNVNGKYQKELYNLTDPEDELLASKKRGNALIMIGSKRLHVVFEIPEYKFEYMGKGGGR